LGGGQVIVYTMKNGAKMAIMKVHPRPRRPAAAGRAAPAENPTM
jgi:hypothetical protein